MMKLFLQTFFCIKTETKLPSLKIQDGRKKVGGKYILSPEQKLSRISKI
jgi:hypothetical protein